jgi:hypothetical protein
MATFYTFPGGQNGRGVKLTIDIHLLTNLGTNIMYMYLRFTHTRAHMHSRTHIWRVEGQIHNNLIQFLF